MLLKEVIGLVYALDFEYDNQYLSDYGFIICEFEAKNSIETVKSGSNIVFNKTSTHNGRNNYLLNAKYDSCIETSFSICKNPCGCKNQSEKVITSDEYRLLIRWLNRKEFLRFRFISKDSRDVCYYNSSFNIETITIAGKLFGLRLNMTTDAPFGYGGDKHEKILFETSAPHKIIDNSDEIGYVYPDIIIYCFMDGDIAIHNDYDDATMIITNCSNEETITIKGDEQIITTDNDNHDICNDFNYVFPKIGNTYDNRTNTFTLVQLDDYVYAGCVAEFIYRPIVKENI